MRVVTAGECSRRQSRESQTTATLSFSPCDEGLLCRAAPGTPQTAEEKLASLKWLCYSRSHRATKLECRPVAQRSTSGMRAQGGSHVRAAATSRRSHPGQPGKPALFSAQL